MPVTQTANQSPQDEGTAPYAKNNEVITEDQLSQIPIPQSSSIRGILYTNAVGVVEDVIPLLRVIISTFITSILFLITDQIVLLLIDLTVQDLKTRIPYVALLSDGVQVLSYVGVIVYFCINGFINLYTQWKISRDIERKSGI
jgi:hypothetical protein